MKPWPLLLLLPAACAGAPSGVVEETSSATGGHNGKADEVESSGPGTTSADESTSGAEGDSAGTTAGDTAEVDVTYAQVQQKSAHNAYERKEALIDQLVYHRVRSLELDLQTTKSSYPSLDGDWYIYHIPFLATHSSCLRLSDCLRDVRVFAEAVPAHEVVTLWLDLKDDWRAGQSTSDLDALLDATLGDALFTPADLRALCPSAETLAEAASSPDCGWPALSELRGKVIVVLTGGNVSNPDGKLGRYVREGKRAFVASQVDAAADVAKPEHANVAILNIPPQRAEVASVASAAGYIARVWGLNDAAAWDRARGFGAHHLATDKVSLHRDLWARTHNDLGWPFSCSDGVTGCEPDAREAGTVVGIEVASGAAYGTTDNGLFTHIESGPTNEIWTTLSSVASSHVESRARGCLMARASLAPGSVGFAVCRHADEGRVTVQLRTTPGASSQFAPHDVVPAGTVEPASVAWLRLELSSNGECATGYGAHRYGEWVEIASHCFGEPLVLRGLYGSSHGSGEARFLFADPHRGANAPESLELDMFDATSLIGAGSGEAFAGPLPQ